MQPSFVYETIDAFDLHPGGAGEMAGNLRKCYEILIEKSCAGKGSGTTGGMAGRFKDDRA